MNVCLMFGYGGVAGVVTPCSKIHAWRGALMPCGFTSGMERWIDASWPTGRVAMVTSASVVTGGW